MGVGRRLLAVASALLLCLVGLGALLFTVVLTVQAVRVADERGGSVIGAVVFLVVTLAAFAGCRALVRRLRRARVGSTGPRPAMGPGSLDRPGRTPRFTDPGGRPASTPTAYVPTTSVPTAPVPTASVQARTWGGGPGVAPAGPVVRGGRRPTTEAMNRRGLLFLVVFTLFFALLTVATSISAVHTVQARHASVRTQAAAPVSGDVVSDTVTRHVHSKSADTFTTDLVVQLSGASDGARDRTVAHVDAAVSGLEGQRIQVVVDPENDGYAELPGRPYTTPSDEVGGFIGLGIFALFALLSGLGLTRAFALRRRARNRPRDPAVRIS